MNLPNLTHPTRRDLLTLLGGLTGALLLPQSLPAQSGGQPTATGKPQASPAPAFDTDPIVVTKLNDTLFVLSGPGGNIALLTGSDGPVLVDTGVPRRSKDVSKRAAAVAHRPVVTVINTHFHFDHTGGNEVFGKANAHIVAHENTRVRLSSPQTIELFNFTSPASPTAALPTVTFSDCLTLYLNGETIYLVHVAPAHTDSDIVVHLPKANVIHAGDLFFNGFYPVIDYSSKGWLGGMVEGIDKVLALADAQTKIIPGHGPIGDREQLQASRTMLATALARIEPMLKEGKSVDDIVAAKPTADLDAQWGKGMLNGDLFVRDAATSIVRHNA